MDTPTDEETFDTIIKNFNVALSRMGPGMGDPVTRGERALLKTFYLFLQEDCAEPEGPDVPEERGG